MGTMLEMKKLILITSLLICSNGWAEEKFDFDFYCHHPYNPNVADYYIKWNKDGNFAWKMKAEEMGDNFADGEWQKFDRLEQPDQYIFQNKVRIFKNDPTRMVFSYKALKKDLEDKSFWMYVETYTEDLPKKSPPWKAACTKLSGEPGSEIWNLQRVLFRAQLENSISKTMKTN